MKFIYDKDKEQLVVSEATRIEYHQMKLWFERFVKSYKFTPAYKMGIWDGKISHWDNGRIALGLWREALTACREIEVPFIIENKEDFPVDRNLTLEDVTNFCNEYFKGHKVKTKDGNWVDFKPRDYQIETAYKILKNKYALAEVATSGGKSLIISIVFFYILKNINPDAKFLLIVPNISLVTQFYDDIVQYCNGENRLETLRDKKIDSIIEDTDDSFLPCELRIEEIMSDKPRKYSGTENPNIYIGCYQSLEKWPDEFFKKFYAVTCDEAHQSKASSLQKIMKRTFCNATMRFGVSGTFPPDDSAEILTIQSVMGPSITKIDAKYLIDNGSITPMKIEALMLNYNEIELNEKLSKVRNPNNGRQIYEYEKKFFQESPKRLEFIKKLVDKKCNGNTLVLFHNIEFGKKIFEEIKEITNIDTFYIDGEISGKKRDIIFEEMNKTDRIKVLIGSYGCLSTGISINSIEYVIFADSFKSESLIIQAIGRSLRKFSGKEVATIYDIVDILDINKCNNTFYRQFKEREKFYTKRKYPIHQTVIKI